MARRPVQGLRQPNEDIAELPLSYPRRHRCGRIPGGPAISSTTNNRSIKRPASYFDAHGQAVWVFHTVLAIGEFGHLKTGEGRSYSEIPASGERASDEELVMSTCRSRLNGRLLRRRATWQQPVHGELRVPRREHGKRIGTFGRAPGCGLRFHGAPVLLDVTVDGRDQSDCRSLKQASPTFRLTGQPVWPIVERPVQGRHWESGTRRRSRSRLSPLASSSRA